VHEVLLTIYSSILIPMLHFYNMVGGKTFLSCTDVELISTHIIWVAIRYLRIELGLLRNICHCFQLG
jgi:hypothetical protein